MLDDDDDDDDDDEEEEEEEEEEQEEEEEEHPQGEYMNQWPYTTFPDTLYHFQDDFPGW